MTKAEEITSIVHSIIDRMGLNDENEDLWGYFRVNIQGGKITVIEYHITQRAEDIFKIKNCASRIIKQSKIRE